LTAILHLRSGSGLYGAERALLGLAGATRAPFVPIVGSLSREVLTDALTAAARAEGVEATHFVCDQPLDLTCAHAVADFIKLRGVALVHAHDFKALTIAALASARSGAPVVATFHGDTEATAKLRAYEAIGRMLGNATRGVVGVSRPLEQRLRRWVKSAPVGFIANGIAPIAPVGLEERARARAEHGLAPDAAVFACIGRLSSEKGQTHLIEALRQVSPAPTLLLAGDGPDRAALERQAQGLPVRFLGYRKTMRGVYAAADAVVLPSLTEGLPMVALEAGLHGKPLLATRVGELAEVLGPDAETLVAPGDAGALATGLQALLSSASERHARGARLKARVEAHYSARAMAARYAEELYAPALRLEPLLASS
jgi:glycosyltransferase involved in cell wall biosynthesis